MGDQITMKELRRDNTARNQREEMHGDNGRKTRMLRTDNVTTRQCGCEGKGKANKEVTVNAGRRTGESVGNGNGKDCLYVTNEMHAMRRKFV